MTDREIVTYRRDERYGHTVRLVNGVALTFTTDGGADR